MTTHLPLQGGGYREDGYKWWTTAPTTGLSLALTANQQLVLLGAGD